MRLVMDRLGWIVLGLVAMMSAKVGSADDDLPADAKPLAEIVASLEASGYKIVEAAFDDGRWEVDAYRENAPYELQLDAVSGKVLTTYRDDADPAPPDDAMPLSKILAAVAKDGYAPVTAADFEHGQWEVEAHRSGAKRELRLDAKTAKVLSDRADD